MDLVPQLPPLPEHMLLDGLEDIDNDDELFAGLGLFPNVPQLAFPVLGFGGVDQDAVARHFERDGVTVVRLEKFDRDLQALVPNGEPAHLSAATPRLEWLRSQLEQLTQQKRVEPVVITGLCNADELSELRTRSTCHLCAVHRPENECDADANAVTDAERQLPRIVATTPTLLSALLQGRMHALVTMT